MNYAQKAPDETSVTFLTGSFRFGGAELVIVNLANHFCKCGFDVTILVIDARGDLGYMLDSRVKIQKLKRYTVKNRILRRFLDFFSFARTLSQIDTKYLISNIVELNIISSLVHFWSRSRSKLILREAANTSGIESMNYIKKSFYRKVGGWAYNYSSLVIANSFYTKKSICEFYGLVPSKVNVIYNPIDVYDATTLRPSPIVKGELLKLISVGRLDAGKNQHDQILAIARLVRRGFKVSLDIVGDGTNLHNLKALVRDEGVVEHVNFVGTMNKPYLLFKNYHIFIHTSLYEGFGNVIVEAMASNIPIVAYASKGPFEELITNSKIGRLCEKKNIDALVAAILSLYQENNFKSDGAQYVDKFSLSSIGDEYLQAISSVR